MNDMCICWTSSGIDQKPATYPPVPVSQLALDQNIENRAHSGSIVQWRNVICQ